MGNGGVGPVSLRCSHRGRCSGAEQSANRSLSRLSGLKWNPPRRNLDRPAGPRVAAFVGIAFTNPERAESAKLDAISGAGCPAAAGLPCLLAVPRIPGMRIRADAGSPKIHRWSSCLLDTARPRCLTRLKQQYATPSACFQ